MDDKQILIKNKHDIENGLDKTIERYLWVRDYINSKSAYTKAECECRLKLMHERDVLERALRYMNIQSFELKSDWIGIKID